MPKLVDTDGVEIKVYFKDHAPPHVHAYCGDEEVLLDIATGAVLKGSMRSNKLEVAQSWVRQNATSLLTRWAQYGGA